MVTAPLIFFFQPHFVRRQFTRAQDLVVPRAPADISFHADEELLARGGGVLGQQRLRSHDQARRAITALYRRAIDELLLDHIELLVVREAFNRNYLAVLHLQASASGKEFIGLPSTSNT